MSEPRPDDSERDPWLSQALRHAPDAQAAPPPALSDAILRQARAAANAARTPAKAASSTSPGAWAAAWVWLARPRVAAGFASVMVATLVGVMWWDQPINPGAARAPAIEASPPAATPPPAAATSSAIPTPTPTPTPTPKSAMTPAPAAEPSPARGAVAADAAAKRRAESTAQRASPAARPAPLQAEPEPARHDAAAARERAGPAPFTDRRVPADAATYAPAASPAPPKPPLAGPESTPPAATALGKLESDRDEPRASAAGGALALRAPAARAAAAAPAAQALRDNLADALPTTLGELLASVTGQPARWRWERSGGLQPMSLALQRWLARLDAAAAHNGQSAAAGTPASSGEIAVLRLYRDGTLAATLRLDDNTVGLVPGPRTVLPAATIAALKQALDDATR